MGIHPTAIISKQAKIHSDVEIGPYVVVRGQVTLEPGVIVDQFATVGAENTIVKVGEGTRIYPGAVVGETPQDLKYNGEATIAEIGKHNHIREYVTIHAGTPTGGGETIIGDHGLFMAYVHIAHDCKVGNHVVIANSSQLAGHVEMEDHAKIGGMCGISQFSRLGQYCYIAGDSAVNKDVLPFAIAQGTFAVMRAANQVGMERSGFSKEDVMSVRKALRIITKGDHATLEQAVERIQAECGASEAVQSLLKFAKDSERGLAL